MQLPLLIILLSVCAVFSANTENLCTDAEKSAKHCFNVLEPVCGIYNLEGKQVKKEYPNRCYACSSKKVQFIVPNSCSSYEKQAFFCYPASTQSQICPEIYLPVCGLFDNTIQCKKAPCGQTYSNKCQACSQTNVLLTLNGECQ